MCAPEAVGVYLGDGEVRRGRRTLHSGEYVCVCLHVYSVYPEEQELRRTISAAILLRSEEQELRRTISELSERLTQITASQSQQVSQTLGTTDPEDTATPCSQPAASTGEEKVGALLNHVQPVALCHYPIDCT